MKEEEVLIKIEQSDRYNSGDVGFIKEFNMGYVQKYIEVTGEEKEKYIAKKEQEWKAYWEANLAHYYYKYKEALERCSKIMDVTKYKIKV